MPEGSTLRVWMGCSEGFKILDRRRNRADEMPRLDKRSPPIYVIVYSVEWDSLLFNSPHYPVFSFSIFPVSHFSLRV